MKIFKEKTKQTTPVTITGIEAADIYDKFSQGINETAMFKKFGIDFQKSNIVKTEIENIENEIEKLISGNYIIEAGKPEERDEEGKIIKEAVLPTYFVPTTKTKLKNRLKSDILDVSIVLNDVIKWSTGNPDDNPTWESFKNSYK